jgi:hypothetical protein
MTRQGVCALALGIAVAACATADGAAYQATLLHPAGYTWSQGLGAGVGSQAGVAATAANVQHAALWRGTADSFVDLHPAGFKSSVVDDASNTSQGGSVSLAGDGSDDRAALWQGTAASFINLNPPGAVFSRVRGVSDDHQVGEVQGPTTGYLLHAALWTGTAASMIDLHPGAPFFQSAAYDVWGGTQVGEGTNTRHHALLWSGTAASVVDLHPAGYTDSLAHCVFDGMQGGHATQASTSETHAILWNGTAASAIDLHPAGYQSSHIMDIAQGVQVGHGFAGNSSGGANPRALLWHGTAASVVDLHASLLGLGSNITWSGATGIGTDGTIVGYAVIDGSGVAVLWEPVPEPGAWACAVSGLATIAACRTVRARRAGDLGGPTRRGSVTP